MVETAWQLSPVPDHRGLQCGLHRVQRRHLQLSHNLPSCLAHAAVPLMIIRQEPGVHLLHSQRIDGGNKAGLVGQSLTER
jgi:hypothetical protein